MNTRGRELSGALQEQNRMMKCLYISGYTADILAQRANADGSMLNLQKTIAMSSLSQKIRQALAM